MYNNYTKSINAILTLFLQGPIGYAPVCSCAPGLKKLEQRVTADRAIVYDHIDASHKTLAQKLEHLDKRTSQQVRHNNC